MRSRGSDGGGRRGRFSRRVGTGRRPRRIPILALREGYSGVVLKTWSVKVVGDGLLGSPPGASGGRARWDRPVQSSGAARAVPAPRPRFASIAHLAWWDGVSHVVTRPGSRARHLTREIVP